MVECRSLILDLYMKGSKRTSIQQELVESGELDFFPIEDLFEH